MQLWCWRAADVDPPLRALVRQHYQTFAEGRQKQPSVSLLFRYHPVLLLFLHLSACWSTKLWLDAANLDAKENFKTDDAHPQKSFRGATMAVPLDWPQHVAAMRAAVTIWESTSMGDDY